MKVILLENIERLGKIGDVVAVKDGFARNYLFPHKKAKEATAGNMKMLDALKKKQAAIEAKRIEADEAVAAKIAALSVTIPAQAGEEDKLFGSVTADMVASGLAAAGVQVDKKDIVIDEAIKKLGSYQVTVRISPEVKTTLRVWVIKES